MAGIDSYTVLMLHCDGSDASTTFTDSETTPKTVTANGNAQIDTAQSVFGGASGLFDGTGDYLTVPDSTDWDFGTGDFTVDFRVRFAAISGGAFYRLFEIGQYSTVGIAAMHDDASAGTIIYINNSTSLKTWAPSINTWYHWAWSRSSGSNRLFIDGTEIGTTNTNSGDITGATQGLSIAIWTTQVNNPLNGWIDEFRISKGIARWTANFTPPTEAYSVPAVGPANVKTYNGLASASVKTVNGLAIASVKTWNGLN